MARKVFISFLGFTNYGYCDYRKDNVSYGKVRFIQEATLDYLNVNETWSDNDVAMILLTEGAKNNNWVDGGQKDRNTKETLIDKITGKPFEGLENRLKKFKIKIQPIYDLPDGNDEKEIWTIFERVFNEIEQNDELYFDITHGFRYLPMLTLVLCNYSNFLKNATIKSITYGNYEYAREHDFGLIVDLLPLAKLQDWTFAAGTYLESGDVHRLVNLCEEKYKPIQKTTKGQDKQANDLRKFVKNLNSVVDERKTCRGMDIIKSSSLKKLKDTTSELEKTFIEPFNPVFEKIKSSLSAFDENENLKNALSAAKWCFNNGLLQQSATILQEFVVSFFCERHNIKLDDEENRELVNKAFKIKDKNKKEEDWLLSSDEKRANIEKELIKDILNDELFDNRDLINLFSNLTEIRNDYNHSGMRSKKMPLQPKNIKDNLEKCLTQFENILY